VISLIAIPAKTMASTCARSTSSPRRWRSFRAASSDSCVNFAVQAWAVVNGHDGRLGRRLGRRVAHGVLTVGDPSLGDFEAMKNAEANLPL
jgi:hypothetical protein